MTRFMIAGYAVLVSLVLFAGVIVGAGTVFADDRPNIILMIADDQGWDGLSVAMAPDVAASTLFHTPRLEVFAAQGRRFSNAYAPAPVCSPSRISIQCGRTPAALHWTKAAPAETGHRMIEPRITRAIPREAVTIGELLRGAGYATAHYGKWHLGGGGPGEHGYDEHDGDTGNEQAFAFTDPNPVDLFGMAERTEAFMRRSREVGKPFYVQLSWNALHAPGNALVASKAKYAKLAAGGSGKRAEVAAITEDLDTAVGMVLDAVDRLGLAGTTYVIYTSDNGAGGGGRRGGLSGGKGSVWEGGIRVPFIVRGPGIAAGSWCHLPVVGWDLLPTFCEFAEIPQGEIPREAEGGSLVDLFLDGDEGDIVRRREELVFHFPHYQSGHSPHAAIRIGNLKLIEFFEDSSLKLFDLAADPGERSDLAAERPKDAELLRRRLDNYLVSVDARMPTLDPTFDPTAPPPPEKSRGGRKGAQSDKKPRKPK
jgi:arylsulfatase A-like enzyme